MSTANTSDQEQAGTAAPGKRPNAFVRLYRGETSFDFVGRRRWWYLISSLIIVAGMLSIGIRGLNLGIDFRGGTAWEVAAPGVSVPTVQKAVESAGLAQPVVEILGGRTVEVQGDLNKLSPAAQSTTKAAVAQALARMAHVPASQVSLTDVGPTWGSQVTHKAILALIVFFVVIVAYISLRFEWKMAIAALVAVLHDLLVTTGVFALTGFQVTPDTVVAVLTILGYSLYDTVVVFDRVGENTKGLGASGRMTYEEVVNLSMNQVLARSVNTSLVAILPVLSVLVVGAEILGATTLQNFGLALAIGLTSGAYSSIFIASPILSSLKEREPRYVTIRQKLASRADRTGILTPRAAAAMAGAGSGGQARAAARNGSGARRTGAGAGTLRPGTATRSHQARAAQAGAPSGPAGHQAVDLIEGSSDALDPAQASVGAVIGAGTSAGTAAASRPGTGARAASATRRPPPRKGKGKSKGGRRR